jgi:hypothetical protein
MKMTWKLFLNVIFIASLLFMISGLESYANRGAFPVLDADGKEVGLYQSSHALLVGASAYREGWPKLPGVLNDIKTVKEALKKRGFTVTVIRDPDHEELKRAFNEFINSFGLEPDYRLLFYFAGHGHTLRQAYGAEMGYIVPVDAPNPNIDKSGFLAKALDMKQFEVWAQRIQSKHALFLFDSCFSGSIFALSRAIPEHISYKTAEPVRQFITSGSADETVPDESIFRHQFLAALDGEADVNKDGYITATELGEFLLEKVANYSRGTQHPQYGKIRDRFLDRGDFVFLSSNSGAVTVPTPKPTPSREDKTPPNRELSYSPSQPRAGQQITFSAKGRDAESGIERMELYVMWDSKWHLIKTCNSDSCEWIGGPFSTGLIGFNAIAYDRAGNSYPWSPGVWEQYITIR